jgi:DNA-binding response OmpR family regulator
MKILLLEDDHLLNEAISKYLKIKGHSIESFRSGSCALKSIKEKSYDLLIIDINVPNLNGLKLLETIKKDKIEIPTIFISAIIDIDDISHAFHLGCADYLKKPFHLKELGLRINKILKSAYLPHAHLRLSKGYSLDMEKMILRFHGEIQVLSERHMKILSLLAANRNRLVDYTLFQEYAWDNHEVSLPSIRTEINRLKKILKEDIIINIRNMGYMIKRPD